MFDLTQQQWQLPWRSPVRTMPIKRHRLDRPWTEELVLDGGRRVVVRPIEPADAPPLRYGFSLLSSDEVRLRFLHPMSELTPALAQQLTELDHAREFALVVAEPLPPGEALIGAVVRAAIDPDGRRAEFAIIVARLLTGQGLGRLLMRKVIHWARLKRLDELYGDVLVDNGQMLTLVRALGFHGEPVPGEPGVVRMRLDLRRGGRG